MVRSDRRVIVILAAIAAAELLLLGAINLLRSHRTPARAHSISTSAPPAVVSFDDWIPEQAVAVLEVSRPDRIVDLAFDTSFTGERSFWASLKPTAIGWSLFRRHLEKEMDCDYATMWHRLVQNGVMMVAGPNETFVAVAQASDAEFLQKLNDVIITASRNDAAKNRATNRVVEATYRNVPYWTLSAGTLYHAIIGNRLVLANQLPALQAVLDLQAGDGTGSLAKRADYRAAKRTTGAGGVATLRVSPELRQFLAKPKDADTQEQNALGVLMFAGYVEALRTDAGWLALNADLQQRSLALRLASDHSAPAQKGPTAFSWPPESGEGAWPNLSVPRQVAALSLYRNLHDFYAAKDALFPERTSQLIFFENMMGIFFTGRDLTEEVMGAVDPHIRIVVAAQHYDPAIGTPAVQIPAFALVFRMNNPKRFGRISEEAWQKSLGLINFTRGQKAESGLVLDRKDYNGVRYTFAAFAPDDEPDRSKLDIRFNYSPCIARPGEYLIFSSTAQLAEDLIDVLRQPAPAPLPGVTSLLEIDGTGLAEILEIDREAIIRGNMLKKGQDRAAAEKDHNNAIAIVRFLERVALTFGAPAGKVAGELTFDLHNPQTAMAAP